MLEMDPHHTGGQGRPETAGFAKQVIVHSFSSRYFIFKFMQQQQQKRRPDNPASFLVCFHVSSTPS